MVVHLRAMANDNDSGIFGYINYLVEKDRKYIIDTLVNGRPKAILAMQSPQLADISIAQVSHVLSTVVTTQLVWQSMATRGMRSSLSKRWARSQS